MMKRLIALARDSRSVFTLTVALGFLGGLATIAQAWLFSGAVNAIFPGPASLPDLQKMLAGLLVAILLRALLTTGREMAAREIAARVKTRLRARLLAHIESLGPAYTTEERTGDLTTALVEGIEALDAYYSQYLPQLILAALVPLSILFFVFPRDWLSGLILLLTAPLIPLFMILIGKGAEQVTRRQYQTLSRLSAHFLDSLQGLTTLKLFGRSRDHARQVAAASNQFRDATLAVLRITFLSALALELLATLSTAVIAVEIGLRLLYGKIAFQQALFLLVIAPEFYIPLRMLGTRFHAGMNGVSAAERIFAILDQPLPAAAGREASPPSQLEAIRFQSVRYTYPESNTPALDGVSFTIQPRQHTALVGRSGAGKSTIFQILLGFRQPQAGQITLGDTDFVRLDLTAWRQRIAWVPQSPYLFDDTIAANIRLARPQATPEEVQAAAQAAQLDDFIRSLPQGYQTRIGEQGVQLSGGEKQRLALARAFLQKADLILLDEPTASLDPLNEARLYAATRRLLSRGATIVSIAHRLETVLSADQVIVLDHGRIAESGPPADLRAQNGLFTRLLQESPAQEDPASYALSLPQQHQTVSAAPLPPDNQHAAPLNPGQVFRRLLGFLRGSWKEVAASVLLGALTIGSNIALLGTSAWLISAAALHPSIAELNVAIVGVRFFGITRGIFRYMERLTTHGVTFNLLARLRTWFYRALEPLAPARLQAWHSGDLLNRVTGDVETLQNFYVRVVAPPLVALVIMAGTSLWLGHLSPVLGWILPIFMLLIGVGLPLLARWLARQSGQTLITARARLRVSLVDHVQGLADLLASGRAAAHRAETLSHGQVYEKTQTLLARQHAWQEGLIVLLTNLGAWTLLSAAAPLVINGALDGRWLAAAALAGLAAFEAVTPLPQAAQMLVSSLQAARRLFEVVDARPAVQDPPVPASPPSAPRLILQKTGFAYPGSLRPALKDISVRLESGQHLAIVGPSGAGKSTLAALLLRFWEYEGEIRLDGRPLRDYAQDDVRAFFSVIPQQTYLFNATLRENLQLATPSADADQMVRAAAQAQLLPLIENLPQGLDTWLGENGARLSGGERQRLGVARALLKNAPIWLLDEPTASLDPLTESALLDTLLDLSANRTTLWITHRLQRMDRMDEIIVLDRGEIVERGTHARLLAQNGQYALLWRLQHRHAALS